LGSAGTLTDGGGPRKIPRLPLSEKQIEDDDAKACLEYIVRKQRKSFPTKQSSVKGLRVDSAMNQFDLVDGVSR
jgi:hypothetical protein